MQNEGRIAEAIERHIYSALKETNIEIREPSKMLIVFDKKDKDNLVFTLTFTNLSETFYEEGGIGFAIATMFKTLDKLGFERFSSATANEDLDGFDYHYCISSEKAKAL